MPEASPGGESRPRLCEKGRRSRQRKTKQEKSPPLRRFAKGHAGPGLQLQLAPRHLGGEAQHVLPPARAVAGKGRGTAGDAVRRLTTARQVRQDLQDLAGS